MTTNMKKQKPKRHLLLRGFLKIGKFFLGILALPVVRNAIWDKSVGKAKEKVIDVEAKVVEEDKKAQKKGLFG